MKGLINIKNNGNKCFLWCHLRHLNPLKKIPKNSKSKQKMVNDLHYQGTDSPVSKKDYSKTETKK